MKRVLAIALVLAAAVAAAASDPPSDSTPAPPPKPRLGGGFKGQPTAPGSKPSTATPPKVAAPGKPGAPRIVIDNSMVKKNAPAGAAKPAPSGPPTSPSAPPSVAIPKIVDLQGHDEGYWRARAAALRSAAQKAEESLAAAQAEEKRQENDFYAWDDGQYRDNVIKPAWDRAREATVKAQQDLDAARKELGDLEDDARKAGAYPGWIRE